MKTANILCDTLCDILRNNLFFIYYLCACLVLTHTIILFLSTIATVMVVKTLYNVMVVMSVMFVNIVIIVNGVKIATTVKSVCFAMIATIVLTVPIV